MGTNIAYEKDEAGPVVVPSINPEEHDLTTPKKKKRVGFADDPKIEVATNQEVDDAKKTESEPATEDKSS